MVDLGAFNFGSVAAVTALASDIGKGVLIDFGFNNTLIIEHIDLTDLPGVLMI